MQAIIKVPARTSQRGKGMRFNLDSDERGVYHRTQLEVLNYHKSGVVGCCDVVDVSWDLRPSEFDGPMIVVL
jgi:hypothetical protein